MGFFLFATLSRLVLWLIYPHIQWLLGIKQPWREVNHSSPSSSEVKNEWSYTPTPPILLHDVAFN